MNYDNLIQLFNLHGEAVVNEIISAEINRHLLATRRFSAWFQETESRRYHRRMGFKRNINSANSKYSVISKATQRAKRASKRSGPTNLTLAMAKHKKNLSLATLRELSNLRQSLPACVSCEVSTLRLANIAHPYSTLPKAWREAFSEDVLASYIPHKAESASTRVAYVQSYAKFIRYNDQGTLKEPLYIVTSPTKFVMLVNEEQNLGFDENQCRKLGEAWVAAGAALSMRVLNNNDSKWVDNEEELQAEWVRIYRRTAVDYSCMTNNPNNAVACYGVPGNNLGLAYWEDGEGNTLSRSVVNTQSKTFSRVYPSNQTFSEKGLSCASGERLLEAAGYSNDARTTMHGVRLTYQEDDDGTIVCPYIDGGEPTVTPKYANATHRLVVDMDGNGDYKAQNSSEYGLVEGMSGTVCEQCGDRYDDEDEGAYVDDVGSVCQHCLDNHFVLAYTSARRASSREEYILESDAVEVNNQWYLDNDDVLAVNDIYRCSQCDEPYHMDDMHDVENVGFTCEDCCVPLSEEFYADADYRHALPEDTTETHEGETILSDDMIEIDGMTYHKDEEITMTAEAWDALVKTPLISTTAPVTATAGQISEMLQ